MISEPEWERIMEDFRRNHLKDDERRLVDAKLDQYVTISRVELDSLRARALAWDHVRDSFLSQIDRLSRKEHDG